MIVGSILIEHDPTRDGDVNSCCFITPAQAVKSTYDTAPVRYISLRVPAWPTNAWTPMRRDLADGLRFTKR
jgi:hypothetical protein